MFAPDCGLYLFFRCPLSHQSPPLCDPCGPDPTGQDLGALNYEPAAVLSRRLAFVLHLIRCPDRKDIRPKIQRSDCFMSTKVKIQEGAAPKALHTRSAIRPQAGSITDLLQLEGAST